MKISNPIKEFIVFTNAYLEGLGRVLMQENAIIVYEPRKLK